METMTDFNFLSPKSLQMVIAVMKLKDPCSLEERLRPTRVYAQSLQLVVSDSLRPHGPWPARTPVHGILQARTLEWVAISFSSDKVWSEWSEVAQSCPTLCDPWTVAHQVSLSVEFSRQEDWSGLPFTFPVNLPNLGVKTGSPTLQADSLPTDSPGKAQLICSWEDKFKIWEKFYNNVNNSH